MKQFISGLASAAAGITLWWVLGDGAHHQLSPQETTISIVGFLALIAVLVHGICTFVDAIVEGK